MKVAQLCNSHGFPHAWAATKYHHIVFREIVKQVEELYDGDCIIVDGTWLKNITTHEILESMYPNVTRENIEHIFYVDLVDPPHETFGDPSKEIFTQLTTARNQHSLPVKSGFSFWGYFVYHEFARYRNIDIPWNSNKLFLSYNRKPYPHRLTWIRTLTDAGLLCKGIVTMGNKNPAKAMIVDPALLEVPDYETPEKPLVKNSIGNVGIPNDIQSIGDHNVWSHALINVVTETIPRRQFLSEKIWKPIIGKRPFMVLGPPHTLQRLKDWGFKTFDKYWDESYNSLVLDEYPTHLDNEESSNRIIQNLEQLAARPRREWITMYRDMQDILEHNHQHFFNEFARSNEALIKTIVKDEME